MKISPGYNWNVAKELDVPPDPLILRLDFHQSAVVMHIFQEGMNSTKIVSAMDIAHALASDLPFSSGLLPANCLWWRNSREGPVYALWEPAQLRKIALQEKAGQPPRRFVIPLPGLIFLCLPGRPPWAYAAKKKPAKLTDLVYKAPLANVFANGRTCPGNHRYPADVSQVMDSFFRSFFSPAAELEGRSVRFPKNITHLWEFLDGKKDFPLEDLVKHGTVKDLLEMVMRG